MYNFSKITMNFMNLSAEWQHWLDYKLLFSQIFADNIFYSLRCLMVLMFVPCKNFHLNNVYCKKNF